MLHTLILIVFRITCVTGYTAMNAIVNHKHLY